MGLERVAEELLKRDASKISKDKLGDTPFYYLTCPDDEKAGYISAVLDSVNFFYGRYFHPADKKSVIADIMAANKKLSDKLSERGLLNDDRLAMKAKA